MASFPLLQLPLVAMENVLCMMSPIELIDVSLASSRTKRVVKNFSRTQEKFSVTFNNDYISISFRRGQNVWIYGIEAPKDSHRHVRIDFYGKTGEVIKKISEEPLKDIMKWFDYAREVLDCKINMLTLNLYSSSIENRQTIDWIVAQSQIVEQIEMRHDYQDSDDDLKYLMERIHVSGNLYLMFRRYEVDLQMEIPGKPNLLHIENSSFIDYDQLLRLESPKIIFLKSRLTNEDINRFLKSWMSCETHLELEAFEINVSSPDAMNQIMDIPHEITNDPEIVKAFKERPHQIDVQNEMFTIKRSDGKKRATVTVVSLWGEERFCLIVH